MRPTQHIDIVLVGRTAMPKEMKKRGSKWKKKPTAIQLKKKRRLEERQKRGREERYRFKKEQAEARGDEVEPSRNAEPDKGMPFYGLLSREEQDYFAHADEMLELNQFSNDEGSVYSCDGKRILLIATVIDRALFVANVFREASGKELKLACSRSCSKLMQRLILFSLPAQLKDVFGFFNGQ